jgi:hypothetical protein
MMGVDKQYPLVAHGGILFAKRLIPETRQPD